MTTHPQIPAGEAAAIRALHRHPWIVYYVHGLCETCWTRQEAEEWAARYRAHANPTNTSGGSIDVYEWDGETYVWRSTAADTYLTAAARRSCLHEGERQ